MKSSSCLKLLLSGDVGWTDWKLLVLEMLRGRYLLEGSGPADQWERLEVEEKSEFLSVETELVSEKSL